MRIVAIMFVVLTAICNAADRQWQTGVCTDAGLKRSVNIGGGASGFGPFVRRRIPKGGMPEVGTYVIETTDLRLELQDVEPIGPESLNVTVGDQVVFAVQKNTVYIRNADRTEHRLRITKKVRKPKL